MKPLWVPPAFESSVLGPIRRGEKARITVQELVGWFGFSRRGTRVNEYIREAFEAHGLTCSPDLEKAFPNDTLTIVGKAAPGVSSSPVQESLSLITLAPATPLSESHEVV